jgi:uncharacterized protein YbjT (DUF2867 family)
VRIPFAHRPAAPIDPADVAAVAFAALTTHDHRNVAYQMSGPEVLTPEGELIVLAEALGRPLRLVESPIDEARAGMYAAGMPRPVIDAIVSRVLEGREGTELLPTVAQILRQPPTTFAQWATAHAGLFTRTELH